MIYYVTFEKHVDCTVKTVFFHCDAKNATEAKEKCRKAWYDLFPSVSPLKPKKVPYQFHLYAKRSTIQDISLLRIVNWANKELHGDEVFNHFITVDTRTWRVNGINKYGVKAGQHYRA